MNRLILVSLLVASLAHAFDIPDYQYNLTDLSSKKIDKQKVFEKMHREHINFKDSICANRAHLWAYDMKRFFGIDSGKIFIFFTRGLWTKEEKGYMYHVAPYIIDQGQEFVMEASYSDLKRPLTPDEWVKNETDGKASINDCVELTKADEDMTEYFYERYNLPRTRNNRRKGAVCYIKKVPGYFWFPASIAYHELGKDEDGKPVEYNPKAFEKADVLDACKEAFAGKLGGLFGGSKQKCLQYLK